MTQILVSRPGLGMEGRPCVMTWNWCFERAGPLGVATQPLVLRLARRAGRV